MLMVTVWENLHFPLTIIYRDNETECVVSALAWFLNFGENLMFSKNILNERGEMIAMTDLPCPTYIYHMHVLHQLKEMSLYLSRQFLLKIAIPWKLFRIF